MFNDPAILNTDTLDALTDEQVDRLLDILKDI